VIRSQFMFQGSGEDSKPPHLYGLPKILKTDIPLRPIVSSIDSPCYALEEFLPKIPSFVVGNTGSYV
jgi:hypothetical protein